MSTQNNENQNNSSSTKPRRKRKKKKKRNGFITFLKWFVLIGMIVGLIGAGATVAYVNNLIQNTAAIDPSRVNDLLDENSVILDPEGRVLETIQKDGLRTIIKYNDISPYTVNAFVAVEDKTFWDHNGFNFIRMGGAVRDALFKGKRVQGTSTITQQLARNLYLFDTRSERSIDRKLKEAYYSIELENYLTKEQILETYLNTIYLGSNSNGVEAAAHAYFSKEAKDLDLVESAMLAGIPSSPFNYSPMRTIKKVDVTEEHYILDDSDDLYTIVYNDGVEDRYKTVLYLMHVNGYITDGEYEAAKDVDLRTRLIPGKEAGGEITSYFSDMVRDDVINDLMAEKGWTKEEALNALYTQGLKIWSTIDFDMQKTLENAYSNRNFTTYFGEPTHNAVKRFQSEHGLTADGIAGKGTLAKLESLGLANTSDFSLSSYRKGTDHEDVILLKRAMDSLGLLTYNDNFPKVTVNFDAQKNIISKESKMILLYRKANLVNTNNQLVIPSSNYNYDSNGNLVLLKNKFLNIYPVRQNGEIVKIKVDVKNTYTYDEENPANTRNYSGSYNIVDLYQHQGRDLLIPDEYKSLDDSGNCVVDKSLFTDYPDFFIKDGNNNLLVGDENYVISDKGIIQPQSAMVIIDYRTGELKAIVGGRNVTGQKIYNRAINPRQPGSSIKPIGVYLPAIDSRQYTAASVFDDVPTFLKYGAPNEIWPINWYAKSSAYQPYWGLQTLRKGIEYSQNVITVKLANALGVDLCIEYLQKLGISTLVLDGSVTDKTLSAVALGGMTHGITPLDITEAYGTIANKGVRNDTITYTKVTDNSGEIILEKKPIKYQVVDAESAFIVQDMMRTGVQSGIASTAQIRSGNIGIPVAGKTGTTSNKLDAWFVGYTPYYVGAVWFGNDVNMPLDQGSTISAKFWKNVMTQIHADLPDKDFDAAPDNLIRRQVDTMSGKMPTELSYEDTRGTVITEWFIKGTEPTEPDDVHVKAAVCSESGKLVTEYCPTTLIEERVFTQRKEPYEPVAKTNAYGSPVLDAEGNPVYILPGDWTYELPTETCDIHNGEYISIDLGAAVNGYLYPLSTLQDGTKVVNFPFDITLKDERVLTLPVGTKILFGGILSLPDGTVVYSDEVKTMILPDPIPVDNLTPDTSGSEATESSEEVVPIEE